MVLAVNVQTSNLDLPTLSLVAVCIAGLLGIFLIIDWMQQRNVRALAWWGSAYLMGASGIALASMPTPLIELPAIVPGALTFLACGMIWNGVRMFQGEKVSFGGRLTTIATTHLLCGRYHAPMWRSPIHPDPLSLEVCAERAGAALACEYANSAEYDAAIIAARRAAGVYGPKRHRRQMLVTAVGIAAGLVVVAFLIV